MRAFAVLSTLAVSVPLVLAGSPAFSPDFINDVVKPATDQAEPQWHGFRWLADKVIYSKARVENMRRRLTAIDTPSPTVESKVCQDLMKKAVDGLPSDEDDTLRTCYAKLQRAIDLCGTTNHDNIKDFCDHDCSDVIADWYNDRVQEGCENMYQFCDEGMAPNVCGDCRTKCNTNVDCCKGIQTCAPMPKGHRICLDNDSSHEECKYQDLPEIPEKIVGKYASNLICSKTSKSMGNTPKGTYCITMPPIRTDTTCSTLTDMACCGPTMLDAGKAWTRSKTAYDLKLKETFKNCMYIVLESHCDQVDMTKIEGYKNSSATTAGGLVALAVALVAAML